MCPPILGVTIDTWDEQGQVTSIGIDLSPGSTISVTIVDYEIWITGWWKETIHMRYVFHVNIEMYRSLILYNSRCESYTLLAHLSHLNTTVLYSQFYVRKHLKPRIEIKTRPLWTRRERKKSGGTRRLHVFVKNPLSQKSLSYLHFYKDLHNLKKSVCLNLDFDVVTVCDRSKDSKIKSFCF